MKAIVTLGSALKFNGGGHLNHSIFWTILCPKGTSEPTGKKSYLYKKNGWYFITQKHDIVTQRKTVYTQIYL